MPVVSIIIIAVLMAAAIVWLVLEITKSISEPANIFLVFINQGLYEKAYDMTHSIFKEKTGKEDFIQAVSGQPFNPKAYCSWYTRKLRNGRGVMYGKIHFDKENESPILLSFLKEDKKWKITALCIGESKESNFSGLVINR
jgi:hypothetical protein